MEFFIVFRIFLIKTLLFYGWLNFSLLTIMSPYDIIYTMFYLLLALLHEEYISGRMDFESYQENIFLLAHDYENLKSVLHPSCQAA